MRKSFWFSAALVIWAMLGAGCVRLSAEEVGLTGCAARETIDEIRLSRESAGRLVPIQERFCETMGKLHDVVECECAIRPVIYDSEEVKEDGSVVNHHEKRTVLTGLITVARAANEKVSSGSWVLRDPEPWDAKGIREEVRRILMENGFGNFTVELPVQSGKVWVVEAWAEELSGK